MEFPRLLEIVGDAPVFETGLLLAGDVNPRNVRRQLSRWTQAGRLYQLRRGLYALAPPFQKTTPHPFVVANHLVRGSYVSCQSALAHYGMIPEYTPQVVSVTTRRPGQWETPLGTYVFHHVKPGWFHTYRAVSLGGRTGQAEARALPGLQWRTDARGVVAFVATPEKALLDLVYLQPGGDAPDYLRGLRLQALEQLDVDRLAELADRPKLQRAVAAVTELARAEVQDYETL